MAAAPSMSTASQLDPLVELALVDLANGALGSGRTPGPQLGPDPLVRPGPDLLLAPQRHHLLAPDRVVPAARSSLGTQPLGQATSDRHRIRRCGRRPPEPAPETI